MRIFYIYSQVTFILSANTGNLMLDVLGAMVQVIASILAIVAALILAREERRITRQEHMREKLEEAANYLASGPFYTIKDFRNKALGKGGYKYVKKKVEGLLEMGGMMFDDEKQVSIIAIISSLIFHYMLDITVWHR